MSIDRADWHYGIVLGVSVGLAGCASTYKVSGSAPTAEFSLLVQGPPTETTARTVMAMALDQTRCEPHPRGFKIGSEFDLGSPATVETPVVKIDITPPFRFLAYYVDARFAMNKTCLAQAGFAPEAGRKYRGVLVVKGDVESCELSVRDVTSGAEAPVAFEMPSRTCPVKDFPSVRNGEAETVETRIRATYGY